MNRPPMPPAAPLAVLDVAGLRERFWALETRLAPDANPPQVPVTDGSDGSDGTFPLPCIRDKKPPTKKNKNHVGELTSKAEEELWGNVRTVRDDLPAIAAAIREQGSVALDLETYGPRKNDGLDPWAGDIRLLSLCLHGHPPWLLDLRALGYDLGELRPALEAVEIIAHNAKFDLLWLRQKCGLRATSVFCTLTAARLLSAGTKPGNDLDKCLDRYLGIPAAPDHSRSDWGSMLLTEDQLAYAARDVAHLHDLAGVLRHELEMAALEEVGELEMGLVPVIVDMEAAGIAVDQGRLREIEARGRAAALEHAALLRQKLGAPKLNAGMSSDN